MTLKEVINLQNAVIRAHQKIKDLQKESENKEAKLEEIVNDFNKIVNELTDNTNKELAEIVKQLEEKINTISLTPGKDGKDGRDGKSAYEIAVEQGFEGTEKEWVDRITNSGGKSYSRQLTAINQKINSKVDKVQNATNNNFASLDEQGNIKDSGNKASDFLTEHQSIKTLGGQSLVGTGDIPLPTGEEYTFNEEHNIREINNDVQVFTDNGDVINDNEMFLKNIPATGTWEFVKDNYENILGYSNGSNIILISKNGGLDFETITMPTIIKSGCYDLANKTYKLLGVQKVFESSDLKNWTPYNTDTTNWDYIGVKVKFTGTTFLSSSSNKRWKECSTSNYAGNYRTYTKTPKSIARINNTSIMMIVNTDNTQKYTASTDTPDLPVQLNANINKIINLNDVVYALCNNSNKLYEYVMPSITVTYDDYWQEYTLPTTCTVEDIAYNSLDGYYYIVNDSNNYFKTKDFETFETVNKNTTRGKYCIRTKEGLIISPNNSNQLLFVPAREKLENRLQQLKMELDKTRWVGDGLELVGEQIKVKGSYNIQVTSSGIYVSDSLDLINFAQDIRTLMRTRLADVLDYPIEGTQDFLDEWIWTEDVLWEKLFDGIIQAIQVRWSVGGTFYEPYGYMEEYTVEKYERGCFYVDQDDLSLKYIKIGVEQPIE